MTGIPNRIPFGISDNNNNGIGQTWKGQPSSHIPAGRHCKILEEFIKRQNEELSHKRRVQEEMRSLIDWLKKDLSEAEKQVRKLEQENTERGVKSDNDGNEDKGNNSENVEERIKERRRGTDGEKEELEFLQEMLLEKNEKISKMEESIGNYEQEIDDLRRENETYFTQIKGLRMTIQKQTDDLKIDRKVEEDLKERLNKLMAENTRLSSQLS